MSITAGSDAHFGPTGQVLVTTFDMTQSSINSIMPQSSSYGQTAPFLIRYAGVYRESGYRPHATVQSDVRFNRGDIAIVDSFALVDRFPDEDPVLGRVIQSFTLGFEV